jgi:hypothetical protein
MLMTMAANTSRTRAKDSFAKQDQDDEGGKRAMAGTGHWAIDTGGGQDGW